MIHTEPAFKGYPQLSPLADWLRFGTPMSVCGLNVALRTESFAVRVVHLYSHSSQST